MTVFLKQSTAVDLAIGPFLNATDGVTAESGLTISQADVRLKKNNAAWAQINDNTSATHEENGWYEKEFDATDTNTVGRLVVAIHESGALPVWHEFWVLEEAIYDALFAASATGALPVSAGGIASTAFAAGAIDAAAIATDAIGAAELADGAITAATFAAGAIDATAIAADAIGASELAADAVAEIADAVWDEAIAGHAAAGSTGEALAAAGSAGDPWVTALPGAYGAGSAGKIIGDNINATVSSRASQTTLDTLDDLVDTEVAAIKTVVDAILVDTDVIGATGGGLTSLATQASVNAVDDLVDTEVAAIKTVVDAIKVVTDAQGSTGTGLSAIPWNASWDAEVQSEVADALESTIADSVPADGTRPSVKQALYMLTQFMLERSITGTTMTVNKVDGTTALFTLTLNDATTPTAVTRAT
jgi:hypothetical protein